jgi:hypothetical protein
MLPREALTILQEDNVVTIRSDGWFYIRQRPAAQDLGRFVLAIECLGAWSVETTNVKARVLITRGGVDARYGLLFKLEE